MEMRFDHMSDTRKFLLALGIGAYALAISKFFSGPEQHTGRWSWLLNWSTDIFGEYGAVYLFVVIGTFLVVKALTGDRDNY
jgi:hypothetical protein